MKGLQRDSLIAAESFWATVAKAGGGDPGYARTGRLQARADDVAVARARDRAQGPLKHWRGHRWQVIAAPDDWAPVSPSGLVVHDTLTARLDPARAVDALVRAIRASGGRIETDAPERGPVIHATGATGLEQLSAEQGREVGRPIKGQAARIALDRRGAPQIFAGGLHIVPHADGTTGVASTTERDFDSDAPDALLDDVLTRAAAAVPAIAGAPVIARWAGMRPRARSRQPILGAWPDRPGNFVANGGFKIGFGTHIPVARLIVDLALDGRDAIPAALRL